MKRKFSKILGVGLTLALLCSLLLTAAPVSALSAPAVTVTPATISAVDAEYKIRFELDEQLNGDITTVTAGTGAYVLADSGDSFVITAAAATDVATIVPDGSGGTVAGTMSGTGTFISNVATFAAVGETCTVTVLAGDATTGKCFGTWAQTNGSPTAVVGVGSTAADTITIVFDTDTGVVVDPTVTLKAGPGWINGVWVNATIGTLTSVVGTVDTSTVVITLPATTKIGEGAEVRLAFTAGITNPDAAGDYNLTVATSKETTAVPSPDYAITVPDIGVLPGVVEQYNAADPMVLMARDTGFDAINDMVDTAGADYTIVVGPGEYKIDAAIVLDQAGLTLKSSAGADDTIIDYDGGAAAIQITGDDATVDGFTVEFSGDAAFVALIKLDGAEGVTVIDNIVTSSDVYGTGILLYGVADATVSGNDLDNASIYLTAGASGNTISGNTLAGGAAMTLETTSGNTISGNTISASDWGGAIQIGWGASDDNLIEGNTLSENTEYGIWVATATTNLVITGNDITGNEIGGILIDAWGAGNAIVFNNISGNEDYGITNTTADAVEATFNWWGTDVADDVAAMVNDTSTGATAYEPFLAGTAEAVFSASDVGTKASALDAKDEVGVKVSVATEDGTAEDATTISVAKYIANPQAAIDNAIAFYDVYVVGTTAPATDVVTIKFYAGDANTEVYLWSADTETWGAVTPVDFSAYGGYVYVTVETDMLGGTPFALVGGAAAALGTPTLESPDPSADDIRLTPGFAWSAVDDAEAYYFELADNAGFVAPLVKRTVSFESYAYMTELDYSSAYYWRVKAVSGLDTADILEGDWASGVFITMDEPEEELPPVVVEEAPPVIIEPIVEVITPAATEITPAWIYVIIAVGAVLVIALLVLIVRTRRVA